MFHGSPVAVKYLKPTAGSGRSLPQLIRDLSLELEIITQLRHPSVVAFMGSTLTLPKDEEDCNKLSIGLIFELCGGGNLYRLINENKKHKISAFQKMSMLRDLATGIAYLHSKNIVHRDLSSKNILLTGHNRC
mmetsp:Transcript_19384/g.64144  ORF Transcript_19384/g.64144 Transcript_19384/m.64144 type:complete len:133 (-) Transcript_19384:3238-3636(-)